MVSIIIPVFNTQHFLSQTIQSCLNQSFGDIEIIIIDDKSTDLSLKIAKSYIDKRIKIIENKTNLGTFLARKKGIEAALGEWILFLDGDDFLHCDAIKILHKKASENNACIVHFGIIHYPPNKLAKTPKIHTESLQNEYIVKKIIIDDFKKSWLNLAGRFYRTNLVKAAQNRLDFIDCHLISSEDSILFFAILLEAKISVGVGENLYFYCENKESIMRSNKKEKYLKQISDRIYLKTALHKLESSHKYFFYAQKKLENMLNYFICNSKKMLDKNTLQAFKTSQCARFSPYFYYSLKQFWYFPRWQILAKLAIFILTFGRKKL